MKKIFKVYLLVMLLFLYFPIFYLVFYSFNEGGDMINFTGFSLASYEELLSNTNLIVVVLNTILIALISSLISVVIGFCGALVLYSIKDKNKKNWVNILNSLFLVSPDVIIGTSLLSLFTLVELKLGFFSVLLSHVAFSVPPVVVIIYAKLNTLNPKIITAAVDLGAQYKDVLRRVLIPILSPALLGGFFMALTYSLDDFAVTFFVTGNGFSTLAVDIYSQARQGISLSINALSTIIFVIIMIGACGYFFITSRRGRK